MVWSTDTPLGPFEYHLARGLRFGDTGLNIGGFSTLELQGADGDGARIEWEGINFLTLFQPVSYARAFAEIELGGLLTYDTETGDVESDPGVELDRLWAEAEWSDALQLRVGKFLVPVGRFAPAPAEPFVWTTSEPVHLELAFDEQQTGAMVHGTTLLGAVETEYKLWGQFFDPIDADLEPEPVDHSVGARWVVGDALGERSLGASFLASARDGQWQLLGGLDTEVHWRRFELTVELTYSRGDLDERDVWGGYLQLVYQLLPDFYLVGRYEHLEPRATRGINVGDFGFAWIPLPILHLKADYRVSDFEVEERGLNGSISWIF